MKDVETLNLTSEYLHPEYKHNPTSLMEMKDTVVMESVWTGELADGRSLKAFFCMEFEFRDNKIYRVRNYDCFESP